MSDAPGSWEQRPLADCGIWLSGGTPSKKNPTYWGGDMPWVGPKDLHERFIYKAEEYLTAEGSMNGTRVAPANSVLIVVRSMALAKGLQIGLTTREVAFNQDIKAILPADDVDPRYLFYALWGRAEQLHHLVDEASHGTKRLRTDVLGNFKILLPPLPEQQRIAQFVGVLDDKIENNRRLARKLEDIAAALFKARFVDFVGRDDLVESEIGPIPRGWRVVAFSDAVEVNPTVKAIKKGSVISHIGMADVPAWGVRPTRIKDREYSGGARFEPGDTLMARITGCIEHGKGAFVDFLDRPSAGSTEFLVFRARLPLTPEMVFLLSRTKRVRDHAIANMSGSSGRQRVQTAALDHIAISVPPNAASVEGEANVFRQVFKQTRTLWHECQTLSQVRDLLLPRLMSGRIPVEEGKAAA